jgi:hypothetical protein
VTTYLAGSVAAPDDEASGAVLDDSVLDLLDFLAFLAFLCFFDFLAFGCVSVPLALLASVPDSPDVADGLLVLEPRPLVSVELLPLAPGVMPVVSLDDAPDAPLPIVPEAPDASLAAFGLLLAALLPPGAVSAAPEALLPVVPDAPLLMPGDEVPLAPDDGDIAPVAPVELEAEGRADLLPVVVSVPVDCASAMDDTDAISTNDND